MLTFEHIMLVLGALAAGGFMSTVFTRIFGTRLGEADLANLSTQIRTEIREENQELRDRMDTMVGAVCGLIDLLDELFPKISGLSAEERIALRREITQARRGTVVQ